MYIHYYLDQSLKVAKITGNLQNIVSPPPLPLGYTLDQSDSFLANKVKAIIKSKTINSAQFSNETPVYNLGFFEQSNDKRTSYFKLLQLSGSDEAGILYVLEYSTVPDIFTLENIDHSVIESIEIARFRDIIKVSSIGILQIDDQWRTLYASKAWSEMTGYSLLEVAEREWTSIIHKDDRTLFLEILHKHVQVEKNAEQDIRLVSPNGESKWFNIHYRISYDELNNCPSITLLFIDIHNKRQSQEHLRTIATTDLLTRLSNRYAFQEALEKYIRQLHPIYSFYVIFIDLDGFKAVNDAYGHHIGDKLLAETARRILKVSGTFSTVARLGGDEFAILRTKSSGPEIEEFAKSLLKEVARPYSLIENAKESYVSASIGVVSVNPSDIHYEDTLDPAKVTEKSSQLLNKADAAMYHAKDSGKNTYRLYSSVVNEKTLKKQLLLDSMHRALENKEFKLHYQPQWNIDTGKLYGYEALLRWYKDGEFISPVDFIPLAESNGLISELGKWVFEQAIHDHNILTKSYSDSPLLSVNFSPIQFRDHNLCEFIELTLNKYDIPKQSVTIEITESLLISNHHEVKSQLDYLKKLGLNIALDDFGTGYSSLSILHNFPIDTIKVDQSFTKNLSRHSTQKIVRAIIKMGKELNKDILFEGIETESQLSFLQDEGVKIIQGWLIAKAMPLEQIMLFMQEKQNTHKIAYS